jgi:hypothetical protein
MGVVFSNVVTGKAQKKDTTADQLDNRRFMSPDAPGGPPTPPASFIDPAADSRENDGSLLIN